MMFFTALLTIIKGSFSVIRVAVFGKTDSFVIRILRLCVIYAIGIMGLFMILTAVLEDMNEDIKDIKPRKRKEVILVEPPTEKGENGMFPDLEGGQLNGLNIMLINNIKTEGYIKEWLTIASKNETGELSDYEDPLSVAGILGMLQAEQGTYESTFIPESMMPFRNGTVEWGKNSYGYSEAQYNLSNLYLKDFSVGGGKIPIHNASLWAPAKAGSGFYAGPFQQTNTYFGNQYKPSKMNKTGKADAGFLPDQINGLNEEAKSAKESFNESSEDYSSDFYIMLSSAMHNIGRDGALSQLGQGTFGRMKSGSHPVLVDNIYEMYKELDTLWTKHMAEFNKEFIPGDHYKWIATLLLLENGWSIEPNSKAISYLTTYTKRQLPYAKILGIAETEAELKEYYTNKTKAFVSPNAQAYGRAGGPPASAGTGFIYKIRDKKIDNYKGYNGEVQTTSFSPIESAGHILACMKAGYNLYPRLLKFAGVDVDPTNPDDYIVSKNPNLDPEAGDDFINGETDGEWVPDGTKFDRTNNDMGKGWILPVHGMVTSAYGPRDRPTQGASTNHKGVDVGGNDKLPIYASRAGKVTFTAPAGLAGNMTIVDHGKYGYTRYLHQSKMSVKVGQEVKAGEVIGYVGQTGVGTGPHLHWEVRKRNKDGSMGDPINPVPGHKYGDWWNKNLK